MKKYSSFFILLGFIVINLLFNYRTYWRQLVSDDSIPGKIFGEIQTYEWAAETVYRNLIKGNNPFGLQQGILYPFGCSFNPRDSGSGFYFLFLRPFFSTHQSSSVIIALSLLSANIGMYLLLRKIGFTQLVSFLIGLCYGFMTFLQPRGGHLNYFAIYLFPWFFVCLISIFKDKNPLLKIISSLGAAFFFFMALWQNKYYFIMLILAGIFLSIYLFIYKKKTVWKVYKQNWRYIVFSGLAAIIFFIPWLKGFRQEALFTETPKTDGWGGAIQFSSDLFGFFIPSIYNRYYGSLVPKLTKNLEFTRGIFENFSYPGIIIFAVYFYIIVFWKKLSKKFKAEIMPYLIASLAFLILTLGPFLHVAGRWTLTLKEGISLVFPLPFIILAYLPFLGNIRIPGRMIVGFIFFAYIVSAYLIAGFLKNKSTKFKLVFMCLFLLVFLIDHRYDDRNAFPAVYTPRKIHQAIKADTAKVSVLEIPFTVRDGFTAMGDGNAVTMAKGLLVHEKPVLGGYLGRVPHFVKQYYKDNLFLGHILRIIEKEPEKNPAYQPEDLIGWNQADLERSLETIDFLDIKYVILQDNEFYSASSSALLTNLGYNQQITDSYFSLWQREPTPREFLEIIIAQPGDSAFLGLGWQPIEENLRWTDKRSSVMFKVAEPRKFRLNFRALTFHQNQPATIYLNEKKIARVNITTEMKDYGVSINQEFIQGINTIHFIFDQAFRPSDIDPLNPDRRQLSARFAKIWLTEIKN